MIEFDKILKEVEKKDLSDEDIVCTGLVIYFLAEEASSGDDIYWKVQSILSSVNDSNDGTPLKNRIPKVITLLKEMNDSVRAERGKVLSKKEIEGLIKRIAKNVDYKFFAKVVVLILMIIPKPANLKMRAQIYLPKKDFLEMKEFLI